MLSAVDVSAGYGPEPVLAGVTLHLPVGEVVGVAGPSGCGKTTLVRVLALLHPPSSGHVELDGEVVRGTRHQVPSALRRRIGLVLQHPRESVDPRLTLADTLAEPLRAAGARRPEVAERVREVAQLVDLDPGLLARRPHEASDGQLQRVSLARALVLRPSSLLLDEATAMLDAATTAGFVRLVDRVRAVHPMGVLTVAHDRPLLTAWCDRVHDLGELAG